MRLASALSRADGNKIILVIRGGRKTDRRHQSPPRFARSILWGDSMDTSDWFRRRRYLHFDEPVDRSSAERLVNNSSRVASHSFYPLIHFTVKSVKVKFDKTSRQLERKEKNRPIVYASHLDSHIYSFYARKLAALYETKLTEHGLTKSILAFRSLGKSNIHFAAEAFESIRQFGACDVIGLDIQGFFDNLNHSYLKDRWRALLAEPSLPAYHYSVFRSLTKYSIVPKEELHAALGITRRNFGVRRRRLCEPNEFRDKVRTSEKLIKTHREKTGIPQGTSISALLSNIYMLEFDRRLSTAISNVQGIYLRYCDDILIVCPQNMGDDLYALALDEIKKIRLQIQEKKTERRTFSLATGVLQADKPLQYLGFLFDGQRVLLRSASLARFSERMRKGTALAKATMESRNALRSSRREEARPLFKKKLYRMYSCVGRRNFLSYGYRAADIMKSNHIKRQLRPLWKRLQNEMAK